MTGNTSDRDGGRSKQYFPMAVDVALLLLLHIHIVNTCLFSALLLSLHTGTAHHPVKASLLQ